MDEIACDVVVCAVVPYGEDDAVVRLLTSSHGRVGAFARKARASKRRFPALAAPALGQARLVPRRMGDLLELKELDAEPALLAFGAEPRLLGYAAYLCELVERLLPESEPAPSIHALVRDGLRALAVRGAEPVVLRAVELQLLLHLGYLPDLSVIDAPGAPCAAYDPATGRLLAAATAGAVPFGPEALEVARALACAVDLAALPSVPLATLRASSRIFAEHLRRHLATPLRSVAFLRALDQGPA